MHLIIGFLRLALAGLLNASCLIVPITAYRRWVDRRMVNLLVLTFYAGAGLDDAAVEALEGMGDRAEPILAEMTSDSPHAMVASVIRQMLEIKRTTG